jgi:hypothetical protein
MNNHRHPKGTSSGGRFAPATAGRADLRLPGASGLCASAQADPLTRYLNTVASFESRQHQVMMGSQSPVSQRLALQHDLQTAWQELAEAAKLAGWEPAYPRPVDPPELVEAQNLLGHVQLAVTHDDRELGWEMFSRAGAGRGALTMTAFGELWRQLQESRRIAYQLEGDPGSVEQWVDTPGRLLVDPEAYAGDGGYDFQEMGADELLARKDQRQQMLAAAFDGQWAARRGSGRLV